MKLHICENQARQIAVGLYRQVGEFIATAKQNAPADYESFKADYIAKQATQATPPTKRRNARNRKANS